MNGKRIISAALSLILSVGAVPAQAAELLAPGGTAATDIMLTSIAGIPTPEIFSATVPAEIPISMDADGNVTVANNLFIENKSSKDIRVTGIQVDGKNGWSVVDFDDDFSAKPIGTKELALSFRGDSTDAGGQIPLTAGEWTIAKDGNLDIKAAAKLPKQVQSNKSSIATVYWTLDWVPDDDGKRDIEITVLPGDHGRSEITSLTPDESGRVQDYPDVMEDTGYDFTNWIDAGSGSPVDEDTVYETNTSIKPVFALKPGWARIPVPDTENVEFVPSDNPEILVDPSGTVQVVPEIVPKPGYVTDGFEDGDGNPVTPGTEINININISITVIVRPENPNPGPSPEEPDKTVTLPVLPGVNGNADADEITTDKTGKIPSFPTVTPDEGYVFDHWEDENGNPVDEDTVFEKPTGVKPVCVPDPDYKPDKTTDVGILPGDHGAADVDKATTDSNGRIPVFPSVTPEDGYEHVGWEKPDGTPVDENTVFGDGESIRPTFEKEPSPIVDISPGDHGNTGSVGEVQTDDSHKIPAFPEVFPDEGYEHTGWEKPDGTPVDENTVFGNGESIRPTFEKKPNPIVKILPGDHGNTGDVDEVQTGDDHKIPAFPAVIPDEGYEHTGWEKPDGTPVDENTVFGEGDSIKPVFSETIAKYSVTVIDSEHGIVEDKTVEVSDSNTILNLPEATPEPGYEFLKYVDENGNTVSVGDTLTADVTIHPVYDLKVLQDFVITSSNRAEVGYTGEAGEVLNIPSEFIGSDGNRYRPVGIEAQAFRNCSNLSSVTVPSGVRYIKNMAFSNCSNMKSITLPDTLTTLGDEAFSSTALTSCKLPNSLTSVGSYIFHSSWSMTASNIPTKLTKTSNGMFASCGISSITIPNNIKEISDSTFRYCSNLKSITIPSSVKTIGYLAFSRTGLTSIVIPNSVTSIGTYAFEWNRSLKSVTVGTGVKTISACCFSGCDAMISLSLPIGLTGIEYDAFSNCTSMTRLEIPYTVTTIGNSAFTAVPHIYYTGSASGKPWGANAIN